MCYYPFMKTQIYSLPNLLTISRIAVIPLLVVLMLLNYAWASWAALGLYTYACVTDFLDGYLARKMNIVSNIGKFLDPIADKLLVAMVILTLAALDRLMGFWIIPALIIIFREIFIAGLREYLGPMNIKLPVSNLAKWKTTSQMFCLGFLIMGVHAPDAIPSLTIGHFLITLAAVLSVITGYDYTRVGIAHLIAEDKKSSQL